MNVHELYQENSFEHSAHLHVCWINWSILAKIRMSTIHSWFHHLHIAAPCLWPKNISCSGLTSNVWWVYPLISHVTGSSFPLWNLFHSWWFSWGLLMFIVPYWTISTVFFFGWFLWFRFQFLSHLRCKWLLSPWTCKSSSRPEAHESPWHVVFFVSQCFSGTNSHIYIL